MPSVDVISTINIDSPISKVASFAANPENAPIWYDNIESTVWESEPSIKVGSQICFVAHFLGRKLEYTYEIVEYTPDQKLTMRTSQGPFPMETIYTWQAIDDQKTEMTLRNRGTPSGFAGILVPFMKMAMKKANRKDLIKLKQVLENNQQHNA